MTWSVTKECLEYFSSQSCKKETMVIPTVLIMSLSREWTIDCSQLVQSALGSSELHVTVSYSVMVFLARTVLQPTWIKVTPSQNGRYALWSWGHSFGARELLESAKLATAVSKGMDSQTWDSLLHTAQWETCLQQVIPRTTPSVWENLEN